MPENESLERYLNICGFKEMTDVQKAVYPEAMAKHNLVVQSVTGTGKTHAYLIPIFSLINHDLKDLQAVITAPTRELAKQIFDMAKPLALADDVDIKLYVGGDDLAHDRERLAKVNPQIAIGTPGRIKQLSVDYKVLNVYKADFFIIDEADMTMDSGFIPLVDAFLALAKEDAIFQVYSATVPESLQPFLKKYLSNPVFLELNKKDLTPLNIKHYFLKTKYRDKVALLKDIMKSLNPYLCIVYCNTQETVKNLYDALKDDKRICSLYGDMEPSKRRTTMREIRELKYTYIISTDLTSRGIDIPGISHIINYELPSDTEFYVHRTGRTGRMLQDGIAISFYDFEDDSYIDKLEEKGLETEYKDFVNGEIVDSKARYERERKDFYHSKLTKEAESHVRHKRTISKKVKPNYKKKFHKEIEIEKRRIIEKKLRSHG